MTLIEFLRARLDEDEAPARDALDIDHRSYPAHEFEIRYEWARHTRHTSGGHGSSYAPGAPSPARVLAEVEAKRRIVDLHHLADWIQPREPSVCDICSERDDHEELHGDWPCQTLRLLALPYADHPDYDQCWKP